MSVEESAVGELEQAEQTGVRAFDQEGREVVVPREQWVGEILPGMLKEVWDSPEQLYVVILNSLNEGFVAQVTEAAAHLRDIDTVPARGVCMWGIVLLQAGRLDEAEQALAGFTAEQGEDGSVLVNLAQVYAARGDMERGQATLWRALELEPNLDNGLGWYVAMQAEAAGEAGAETAATVALERIAAMPTSWRAQLWLARLATQAGDLARARQLYTEALERAPRPVPPDLLMQMSGDLGGSGHLAELLEFTAPHFIPTLHGLPVGNNLIKAFVDTGNLDAATMVTNALLAVGRPDWQTPLGFWDQEITRRRAGLPATAPNEGPEQQSAEVQIGLLRVDGPVWLPPQSPARALFGARAAGPAVTFLGGTAEAPEPGTQLEAQRSDAVGRMTRALPLYLAEQVDMRTAAAGRALLPWAVAQGPESRSGFVVSSARWPDATVVQMVGDPANRTEYVVSVHLDAEVEPWTAELAFVRTADGVRIGELQAEFSPQDPESGLPGLADEVVELLSAFGSAAPPAAYQVPGGAALADYLLRLEQLLAVRCTGMEGVQPISAEGGEAILAGELALCQAAPASVPARLLLIETLGAFSRTSPEIAAGFREPFERLIAEQPLPALDAVFGGTTTA